MHVYTIPSLADANSSDKVIFKCEQAYMIEGGFKLDVLKRMNGGYILNIKILSSGDDSKEISHSVELDTMVENPLIFKNDQIMLKISTISAPAEPQKKLATLISYEGGSPDSESLYCVAQGDTAQ